MAHVSIGHVAYRKYFDAAVSLIACETRSWRWERQGYLRDNASQPIKSLPGHVYTNWIVRFSLVPDSRLRWTA